jgi:hypothetical protein
MSCNLKLWGGCHALKSECHSDGYLSFRLLGNHEQVDDYESVTTLYKYPPQVRKSSENQINFTPTNSENQFEMTKLCSDPSRKALLLTANGSLDIHDTCMCEIDEVSLYDVIDVTKS